MLNGIAHLRRRGSRKATSDPNFAQGARLLSVLAWGRNVEGQCGVETSVIVATPTPVIELQGAPVCALKAGKLNSAAILHGGPHCEGEAWTWGCGKAGKLGQGSSHPVHEPSRVESLVGRASVADVALGEQHSVFLDARGGIWACGENRDGQCGLGTPIEVIASQRRKAYYDGMRPARGGAGISSGGAGDATLRNAIASSSGGSGRSGWGPREQQVGQQLKGLMQQHPLHQQQHRAGMQAFMPTMQQQPSSSGRTGWAGTGPTGGGLASLPSGGPSLVVTALGWGGFDMEGHLNATGMQPGQLHVPMRIGRDQHPLSGILHRTAQPEPDAMQVVGPSGLEDQEVVACDASRYFSVAATSTGQVWTFGACYDGSLGSDASWSTSAQQVSGPLADAIADGGGAVRVAAGGTFCLALTAQSRVVVWGKLPGGDSPDPALIQMLDLPIWKSIQGARVVAGVIEGLPPIRYIAAGQSHALLSDGERVWGIGKMVDSAGKVSGSAPWTRPLELLHLPAEGIQSISCGVSSSAAVSGDGQLYMWGRLLEFHHAESLIKRHAASHAYDLLVPEDVRWQWAGFGADRPTLVRGVSGVKGVALGGWHALVLVD